MFLSAEFTKQNDYFQKNGTVTNNSGFTEIAETGLCDFSHNPVFLVFGLADR